jgi:hypothetical protein
LGSIDHRAMPLVIGSSASPLPVNPGVNAKFFWWKPSPHKHEMGQMDSFVLLSWLPSTPLAVLDRCSCARGTCRQVNTYRVPSRSPGLYESENAVHPRGPGCGWRPAVVRPSYDSRSLPLQDPDSMVPSSPLRPPVARSCSVWRSWSVAHHGVKDSIQVLWSGENSSRAASSMPGLASQALAFPFTPRSSFVSCPDPYSTQHRIFATGPKESPRVHEGKAAP